MARTAASSTEPRVVVSSQVTEDVRTELERRARTGDRSLSAEVRRAIHEHLQRQIRNETSDVARVLIMSSNIRPDVAEYPETGKIGYAVEDAEWEYHLRGDAVPHAGPE